MSLFLFFTLFAYCWCYSRYCSQWWNLMRHWDMYIRICPFIINYNWTHTVKYKLISVFLIDSSYSVKTWHYRLYLPFSLVMVIFLFNIFHKWIDLMNAITHFFFFVFWEIFFLLSFFIFSVDLLYLFSVFFSSRFFEPLDYGYWLLDFAWCSSRNLFCKQFITFNMLRNFDNFLVGQRLFHHRLFSDMFYVVFQTC